MKGIGGLVHVQALRATNVVGINDIDDPMVRVPLDKRRLRR
jgi:hypothetical protein